MSTAPESACSRREFSKLVLAAGATAAWPLEQAALAATGTEPLFRISLAEWSLHRMLFDRKLDHLDFAGYAQREFGIDAVEYVNQFFMDKAQDADYIAQMKCRAEDAGVKNVLIMCDGEGHLGDPHLKARLQAVEHHYKGVLELMPFAKAVSAKTHDFNEHGEEIHTDYLMMMKIVLAAGYHSYVGIEYEGNQLSEPDGIIATKKLLERVRQQLA